MAPFEVVIFHHLPGDHRAWCTAETAAELERTGIAKRRHTTANVTRAVYRHQIADKVSAAAQAMDRVFGTGSVS
jgi:hypothetical protein